MKVSQETSDANEIEYFPTVYVKTVHQKSSMSNLKHVIV